MKFSEYYKNYLTLHQNKWNRRLHVIGQFSTMFYIFSCFYSGYYFLLLLAPFVVYPFAWSGHFYFEKNKPAAFTDPIKAKLSDWVMLKDWILGRIER
jgi:hypothetical protein|tara:strand:- start:2721 stop:3011 length:291 start_codon:yes stop_codon:yes gene_type:complete